MPDNHTGIGHVVRCNHHSKPGKGGAVVSLVCVMLIGSIMANVMTFKEK